MSNNTCDNCNRPTANQLCNTCITTLAGLIKDMPALARELETTIAGLDRHARNPGRSPDRPLPVNLAAAERRTDLRRFIALARVASNRTIPHVPAATTALLASLNWFRTDPRAHQAHDAIHRIHERITAAIDHPDDTRHFAGPCHRYGCTLDLYTQEGTNNLTCDGHRQDSSGCGHTHTPAERATYLAATITNATAPLDQITETLPTLIGLNIPANRIRQWRQRGNLTPIETKLNGNGTIDYYRIGDLINLATRTNRPGPKTKATT